MSPPARRRRSRCAALPAITPIAISMAAIASSTMPHWPPRAYAIPAPSSVAILDVDFHHGNGTQDIFYRRKDVLFCSLHGQPQEAFPYFLGFADEIGHGEGEGFNFNYPMPPGTAYGKWRVGLDDALRRIRDYGPDVLVVSLGVDTYKDDPISFFKLELGGFRRLRPAHFRAEAADPVRHGGWLRHRGDRHQCRQCPDRLPRAVTNDVSGEVVSGEWWWGEVTGRAHCGATHYSLTTSAARSRSRYRAR